MLFRFVCFRFNFVSQIGIRKIVVSKVKSNTPEGKENENRWVLVEIHVLSQETHQYKVAS